MPASLEARALAILAELLGCDDLPEFCAAMMAVLREAVPADWCALNEVPADVAGAVSMTDPPVPAEFHEAFARYGHEHPIAAHFISTGDGRATRFSDLISSEQLHRLELYRCVYHPPSVEYQIAFTLRLIATGRTAAEAAGMLEISTRTAQKHLEGCYRTLEIHSRSQAAAVARQTAAPPEPLTYLALGTGWNVPAARGRVAGARGGQCRASGH